MRPCLGLGRERGTLREEDRHAQVRPAGGAPGRAHLKKGQGCVIYAQVEQHEFAQLVAEEAYRAGAKWVEMRWEDQVCTKLKYRHETLTQLSQVAEWEKARHAALRGHPARP